MLKIKFNSAQEMILWLMNNEGYKLADNYGRFWKYLEYTFFFQDICDNDLTPGMACLHLFSTDLYHEV